MEGDGAKAGGFDLRARNGGCDQTGEALQCRLWDNVVTYQTSRYAYKAEHIAHLALGYIRRQIANEDGPFVTLLLRLVRGSVFGLGSLDLLTRRSSAQRLVLWDGIIVAMHVVIARDSRARNDRAALDARPSMILILEVSAGCVQVRGIVGRVIFYSLLALLRFPLGRSCRRIQLGSLRFICRLSAFLWGLRGQF